MPIEILMPALSPTMEKGTLARWHVKEGDKVAPGDVVAEIETDKATMEVEAVDEGTVSQLHVAEGTADVPVNTVIATLAGEGEAPGKPAPAAAPAAIAPAPAAAPVAATPARPQRQPACCRCGAECRAGCGRQGLASPLARRIAREKGVDIAAVAGSGPRGRIIVRDVEAAIAGGLAPAPVAAAAAPVPAIRPMASGPSSAEVKVTFAGDDYEAVPHDTMRKVIARRLTESKQTVPHFYLAVDCRLDALLEMREKINAGAPKGADGKPAFKLSVNDFVIKALGLSLRDVPDANVTWTEEAMLRHRRSDVGVAVAIPGGLITPVVRGVESKTLTTISAEMKDFAARARARKLMPEEYTGGTTAISNLGMFGIKEFSAVINPPHATILAVGAGEERAVVENGAVVIANVMTVTLSTDHRAVDGALGAELIGAFKRYIENPLSMLV
ncbi:MAG: pyruvate dehydrogenase complex dihydrolipoamide acetyltransferase [Hyphomicrobiales bacterium]